MDLYFAHSFLSMFPWEVAILPGLVLFAASWLFPWRIVSLPSAGSRGKTLLWAGTAGSLGVATVASIMSAINLAVYEVSGFDGWWRRPAPLVAAILVLLITALVLRQEPLPVPGERAIAPRRSWHTFISPSLLWSAGITGALLTITTLWQIMIATSAPESGPFVGRIQEYTPLPIFMSFNAGNGYAPGAGWPNHLATLLTVILAGIVLFFMSRVDTNRPLSVRASAQSARADRESTARLMALILLAGLITTLGAVWMHTGLSGQTLAGYNEQWVSENVSYPTMFVSGSYSAIATEMNLTGYLLQGAGVALALRTAVDTARSYRILRAAKGSLPEGSAHRTRIAGAAS